MKNISLLIILLALSNCNSNTGSVTTPKKYQYTIEQDRAKYSADTTAIQTILRKMVDDRVNPFDIDVYDNDTHLYVDSLVYSPDRDRMILFVVARNSTGKLKERVNNSRYYYDAYYLFCSRDAGEGSIRIYDRAGFRLSNFFDHNEIRRALRNYCFTQLGADKAEQHFNIDDVRFWTSPDFEWVLKNSRATSL